MKLLELRDQLIYNYSNYMKKAPWLGSDFYYDVGCAYTDFVQYKTDTKGLEHLVSCVGKSTGRKYVFIVVKNYESGKKRALGRIATVINAVREDYKINDLMPQVFITSFISEEWKKQMKSFIFVDAQEYLDKMAKVVHSERKERSTEKVGKMDQPWFKTDLNGYKTSFNKILTTHPNRKIVYQVTSNKDCFRWNGSSLIRSSDYRSNIEKICDFFKIEKPVIIYLNPTVFKMFGNMADYEDAYTFYTNLANSKKEAIKTKLQEPVYSTSYYAQGARNMAAFLSGCLPENHLYMKVLNSAINGSNELADLKRRMRDIGRAFYSYDEMNAWINESEHDIDEELYKEYPLLRWCSHPYERYRDFVVDKEKATALIDYIEMVDAKKAA